MSIVEQEREKVKLFSQFDGRNKWMNKIGVRNCERKQHKRNIIKENRIKIQRI